MLNSQAKEQISRRTPPKKRERIQRFADSHGLTYSQAEERLLTAGLTAEDTPFGDPLPDEVTALYFGGQFDPEDLENLWTNWRDRTEPPHDCWWAFWRVDKSLSAPAAERRAEAARAARVTPKTGTSWTEQEKDTEKSLVFFLVDTEDS